MSRCWCFGGHPNFRMLRCKHWSWKDITLKPKSLVGYDPDRCRISIFIDLGGPSPIGDRNCFNISRSSIQKCQDIVGLIGVKDGHGLLVEEVIEPKNPGWAVKKMGRNGRVFCCFCQDVCLFSFPLTGVFLKNWFMRGGTCEIFIRLRFDSFTQKLP